MDIHKSSNTAASNDGNQRPLPQHRDNALSRTTGHAPSVKPKPPRLLRTANPNSKSGRSETDNRVHSTSLQAIDPTEDYADIYIMDSLDCQFPTRSCFRGGSISETPQGQSVCNVAPTPYSFSKRYQGSVKRRNCANGTVSEQEYGIEYSAVRDSPQPHLNNDGRSSYGTGTSYTTRTSRSEHLRQSKKYDRVKLGELTPGPRSISRFTISEDVENSEVRSYTPEHKTVSEEHQRRALSSDVDVKFSHELSKPSTEYDPLSWELAEEIGNMRPRLVLSSVSSRHVVSDITEAHDAVIQRVLKPSKTLSIKDGPSGSWTSGTSPSTEFFREGSEKDSTPITITPREKYGMVSDSVELWRPESVAPKEGGGSTRCANKAVQTVSDGDIGRVSSSRTHDARSGSVQSGDDRKAKYPDAPKESDKNKRELQGILKGSSSTQRAQQEGVGNTITFAGANSSSSRTGKTDDTTDTVDVPAERDKSVDKAVQVSIVRPDMWLIACSIIASVLAITLLAVVLFVLL